MCSFILAKQAFSFTLYIEGEIFYLLNKLQEMQGSLQATWKDTSVIHL